MGVNAAVPLKETTGGFIPSFPAEHQQLDSSLPLCVSIFSFFISFVLSFFPAFLSFYAEPYYAAVSRENRAQVLQLHHAAQNDNMPQNLEVKKHNFSVQVQCAKHTSTAPA